jgi:hypothetical protein
MANGVFFPKIPKFLPSLNEEDGKFGFEISYQLLLSLDKKFFPPSII